MKFTFLGTGTSQGIPVIGCQCAVCLSEDIKDKRLRSSGMIQVDDLSILIDIGTDFRSQMLNNDLSEVDAILLTHEHNDHVAGLDDIRPVNFHYKNDIPIYGQARVLDQLKERFSYAFSDSKYPGAPTLSLRPIEPGGFNMDHIEITAIEVLHGRLPILGYRIYDFVYLTDVKTISDTELKKLKDVEVLVINALQRKPHFSHLTFDEAIDLIDVIQPKKAFLTHASHHLGSHGSLEEELKEKNVFMAYDGLQIEL